MIPYLRLATEIKRHNTGSEFFFGLFFLAILIVTSSCNDAESDIGLNLRADNGEIYSASSDTFTVRAFTVREDPIKTDSLSTNILGAMYDPEFGISTAGIASQLTINQADISFGPSPKVDSVVLYLRWDKQYYYGNLKTIQYLNVYYLDEVLDGSKKYYSNYQALIGKEVGNWGGVYNLDDSIKMTEGTDIVKRGPGLRIKLNKSVGTDLANADPKVYSSVESFKAFFKGLVIMPQMGGIAPGQGGISGVDFFSGNSRMVVHFNDTLQHTFVFNNNCENYNLYNHKTLNPDIKDQLGRPGIHYDRTYVQSMGGCKTKIEIPYILNLNKNLSGERIVINEAALVLTPENGTISTNYYLPSRLYLFQPDKTTGQNSLTLDLLDYLDPVMSAYSLYGGQYNSLTGEYTIRFTRQLQYMLDQNLFTGEDLNRGFYLTIPSDKPITPTRLILNTRRLPDNKYLKLRLTYTKIKT